MWKKIFSCMLCLILVAVPFVQRTHAVLTTASLAAVLILTVMVAMGITLVVVEGSKEDFILNKGSSFMTAKGYSGSFQDWILSGTETEIGLKTGFLLLSKTVVDNIKEFVAWLIPSPVSDTVIDFNDGSVRPASQAIFSGTIVPGVAGYANFKVSGVFFPSADYASTISDGTNTVTFVSRSRLQTTGRYQASTGIYSTVGYDFAANGSNFIVLCLCSDAFINRGNTCLPGIYFGQANTNITQIELSSQSYSNLDYVLQINDLTVNAPSSDASAIVGNFNDLDDLTDTTTVGTGGTTTVSNTFYITTDGQALDPSTQDLADILDALRQALDNLNQKTEVTGWTAATAAEGEVSPPYDDFDLGKLDFNGLRALITTRFPFCIPWDFVRIIELFVADPEAPHWEIDMIPISSMSEVDTTVSLDLGDYPIVGTVSRWFCIIDLCLGLVFATKKLIWTA